jgi:hypothetical protein
MADVRGQLLLVFAFALALVFVLLAVLLNAAIATETLAARGGDTEGALAAPRFTATTDREATALLEKTNAAGGDHATLRDSYNDSIADFEGGADRHAAVDGRHVNVTVRSVTEGTRIEQSTDRAFTNATGERTDWTLVSNADRARAVRIYVADPAALEPVGSPDAAAFVTGPPGDQWQLTIARDGAGAVVVTADGPAGPVSCAPVAGPVWVNVSAGTVGGQPCDGLGFAEGVATVGAIDIKHGDNVTGRYHLLVANGALAESPSEDYADVPDSPHVSAALYDASVEVRYETDRLVYTRTLEVLPDD